MAKLEYRNRIELLPSGEAEMGSRGMQGLREQTTGREPERAMGNALLIREITQDMWGGHWWRDGSQTRRCFRSCTASC